MKLIPSDWVRGDILKVVARQPDGPYKVGALVLLCDDRGSDSVLVITPGTKTSMWLLDSADLEFVHRPT